MPRIKKVTPSTKKATTKKEEIEEEIIPDSVDEDIEENIDDFDNEEEIIEDDSDIEVTSDIFDEYDSDEEEKDDSDIFDEYDSDEDIEEDVEDEDLDEDIEEDVEEKPVVKKVSRSTKKTSSIKETKPTKSSNIKKETKSANKKTVKPETKKTVKKVTERKTTKPVINEEHEEEESSNKIFSIDNLINAKKIIRERSKAAFNSYVEAGNTEVDLNKKSSVSHEEVAKLVINNIYNIINNEDSELSGRLLASLNLENINIRNIKAIIDLIENTQLDCIRNKKKFKFSNLSMKTTRFLPKVTLKERLEKMTDDVYTEGYREFSFRFPVNEKKIHHGNFDKETGIFTDNEGNEYDVNEDTQNFIKEDKKNFPNCYPEHLYKKNNKKKSKSK